MKKYYYIDYSSAMFVKLHSLDEKLETTPRNWKEVTEEEFKACNRRLKGAYEDFKAYAD